MKKDFSYSEILATVQALPPMTSEEKIDQAIDFAYGNLALSTNHKPKRLVFLALCHERGWSLEKFEAWAATKEWA